MAQNWLNPADQSVPTYPRGWPRHEVLDKLRSVPMKHPPRGSTGFCGALQPGGSACQPLVSRASCSVW
jgi:hypothetical protein